MNLKNNTILITGGSNGIGLAMAERFLQNGNEVIICGRREEKLVSAKEKFPQLHIRVCDVGDENQRIVLYERITREFPKLNVLVNNAGIQQIISFSDEKAPWDSIKNEIAINFMAPLHLTKLFLKHLKQQTNPVIINVSSGLAFMPHVMAPIYSSTKAALHSFTFSLRQQLSDIEVIEIIPPAVKTDLGGVGVHSMGVPLDEFASSVFMDLTQNKTEIGFGYSLASLDHTRKEMEERASMFWERTKD